MPVVDSRTYKCIITSIIAMIMKKTYRPDGGETKRHAPPVCVTSGGIMCGVNE